MEKVIVSADALRQVLQALNGPGHRIMELQILRNGPFSGDNPINKLVDEYNAAVQAPQTALPPLAVWFGAMPESNGKTNWTAILHRRGEEPWMNSITIERSEFKDRVRYEADRLRWLIGELEHEPDILAYDDELREEAKPVPLTQPEIAKALAGAGLKPEDYREDGQIEPLARAIESAVLRANGFNDLTPGD